LTDDANADEGDDNNLTSRTFSSSTGMDLSEVVLNELLTLLRHLAYQQDHHRPLTLILAHNFIPDSTKLHRILEAAAPSLVQMETNHPHILKWLTQAHLLQTLAMELSNTHTMRRQQLEGLMTLMRILHFPVFPSYIYTSPQQQQPQKGDLPAPPQQQRGYRENRLREWMTTCYRLSLGVFHETNPSEPSNYPATWNQSYELYINGTILDWTS
jgi:hypothetical protein